MYDSHVQVYRDFCECIAMKKRWKKKSRRCSIAATFPPKIYVGKTMNIQACVSTNIYSCSSRSSSSKNTKNERKKNKEGICAAAICEMAMACNDEREWNARVLKRKKRVECKVLQEQKLCIMWDFLHLFLYALSCVAGNILCVKRILMVFFCAYIFFLSFPGVISEEFGFMQKKNVCVCTFVKCM